MLEIQAPPPATAVNLGWTTTHHGKCESCRTAVRPAVIVRDGSPEDLEATVYLCVPCASARLQVGPAAVRQDAAAATGARMQAVARAAAFTGQFPAPDSYPDHARWQAAFTARAAELGLGRETADERYGRDLATIAVDGLSVFDTARNPAELHVELGRLRAAND